MNFKQSVAFGLIRRHILDVKMHGQDNVQQLLLDFSGASGTGKSFFLNTVKSLRKSLDETASTFLQLHCERLKEMRDTFSNAGILFIDKNSMVGQKIFTMVSKRLQEARPHYKDK